MPGPGVILIVQDDATVRGSLAEALERVGARVEVAALGQGAVAQLARGAVPAVIVLDERLARAGSERLLRDLRADARYEHVPVITLSGSSSAPGAEEGAGATELTALPRAFEHDDLLRIVLSLSEAA